MGGDVEQKLRFCVILAEYGERAVIRGAGLCRDALRHFLLHHDGDGLEALRFQQRRENGGGDVIGEVGAGHGAESAELLLHQRGDVLLQHVSPENFQIGKIPHGDVQNGFQALVHLHRADLPGAETQLLGQRADAGADLQHARRFVHPGLFRNGLGHPRGNEEVLPLGLGKVEAVGSEHRLHHLNIAYIDHTQITAFLRLSYQKKGGFAMALLVCINPESKWYTPGGQTGCTR